MDIAHAAPALAALGGEHRLHIFRMLMHAGPPGLTAGALADLTAIPPSALTFHAGQLVRAGLVRSRREGRHVHYSVDMGTTRELLVFLTRDCCNGHPELCGPALSDLAPTPRNQPEPPDMTEARTYNALFLCTGNSARSIIAESIMNRIGHPRFRAYSAGSQPKETPHPFTLDLLGSLNHPLDDIRSKSWDEFATPDAPKLDFVFTVCDNAANEVCPIWPGQPMSAHWGLPDPAAAEGTPAVRRAAFAETYRMLHNRISIFVNLPVDALDRLSLQKRLDEIGRTGTTLAAGSAA